jgi:ABC-type dipeptide/oligopeptide/nickel transport system permease subunit
VTPEPRRPLRPRAARSLPFLLGSTLVGTVTLAALAAPLVGPLFAPDPYTQVAPRDRTPPTPPDREHPFGTDSMGRDLVSRVLYGARLSLVVAVGAQAIALALGLAIGAAAGWLGGAADALAMRASDLLLALPAPLVALAVAAAVPEPERVPLLAWLPVPSAGLVLLVLAGLGWAGIARLVRGEIVRLRAEPFTGAARAAGAGPLRIVGRHLLPNALGPIVVVTTLGLGGNILMEAWLSFLGVGARPPIPSWGTMIAESQIHFLERPWAGLAPGLAILAAVLGFNLLGDALRDRLDPRSGSAPA